MPYMGSPEGAEQYLIEWEKQRFEAEMMERQNPLIQTQIDNMNSPSNQRTPSEEIEYLTSEMECLRIENAKITNSINNKTGEAEIKNSKEINIREKRKII